MENILAALVIITVVALAAGYVCRAKRRGVKCIGCPMNCKIRGGCSGNCKGCGDADR